MNNYRKNYLATGRTIPKGWHVHHIVPRSEGGSNDASNLICVHPKMHTLIHEMRGDIQKGNMLIMSTPPISVSRRGEDRSEAQKQGNKIVADINRGRTKLNHKGRAAQAESISGDKNPSKRKEVRDKIRLSKLGIKPSEDTLNKLRSHKKTNTHKKRLSDALKNQAKFKCPHCVKVTTPANLSRWHGDNCKLK